MATRPNGQKKNSIITAVRLDDGKRVSFDGSQGSRVAMAVEASSAIPGFFTPVEINDVDYIDGGVHSPPTPIYSKITIWIS